MKFKSLYSLICERDQANVLTHDTLVKYYYYHIGFNEKNVKAIYKYLQDNNIPKTYCMIIEDIEQEYFFLITKLINSGLRAKEMNKIKKLVDADSLLRITQFGEYPAEDLEENDPYEYEPMSKYNVESKLKRLGEIL